MKYTYDATSLTLFADEEDKAMIRECVAEEPSRGVRAECEVMEGLLANSALSWINPEDTGDLTEAPMLGIEGGDEYAFHSDPPEGCLWRRYIGRWEDMDGVLRDWWSPIMARWAFMDYQVRSFLDDLLETGEARFTGHADKSVLPGPELKEKACAK